MPTSSPPLHGLRVIELAGLAPAPFTGLILADYGASVLRIDRPSPSSSSPPSALDPLTRHKASLALNLRSPRSLQILLSLLSRADVLLDPYRPGTLESLSPLLYPDALLKRNPRLIVARLGGYRRDAKDVRVKGRGKGKGMAGHDINYLALSGVLSMLGRKGEVPYPPPIFWPISQAGA